jgi:hypothetical protein
MSWEELRSIQRDVAAEFLAEQSRPPLDCPAGDPLTTGPDGVLFCTFDGWRSDDQ